MTMGFAFRSQSPSRPGKPWVICIHGLGMSEKSWTDPCSEALIDGSLSFDFVLTDLDHPPSARTGQVSICRRFFLSTPLRLGTRLPDSFWQFLGKEGWGLIVWSQTKPCGSMSFALKELQAILEQLPLREPVVLLAHSRGGLIARKYLQERLSGWQKIKALILLGSPNHGSQIAAWANSLGENGLASFMTKIFLSALKFIPLPCPDGFPSFPFRSLQSYLRNSAIAELSPNSPLIRKMFRMESVEKENQIPYFNFIGLQTTYLRIYRQIKPSALWNKCRGALWVDPERRFYTPPSKTELSGAERANFASLPMVPVFSLLDGLEKIFPHSLLPLELRQGRGDGQVSAKSAHLPWASHNQTFPLNHAQLLVAPSVQNRIRQILKEFSKR